MGCKKGERERGGRGGFNISDSLCPLNCREDDKQMNGSDIIYRAVGVAFFSPGFPLEEFFISSLQPRNWCLSASYVGDIAALQEGNILEFRTEGFQESQKLRLNYAASRGMSI